MNFGKLDIRFIFVFRFNLFWNLFWVIFNVRFVFKYCERLIFEVDEFEEIDFGLILNGNVLKLNFSE